MFMDEMVLNVYMLCTLMKFHHCGKWVQRREISTRDLLEQHGWPPCTSPWWRTRPQLFSFWIYVRSAHWHRIKHILIQNDDLCYDLYVSFNGFNTFSLKYILSYRDTWLSYHKVHYLLSIFSWDLYLLYAITAFLISMLCMAMPSFLPFHSDASCITHVYTSILCIAYLIPAPTA